MVGRKIYANQVKYNTNALSHTDIFFQFKCKIILSNMLQVIQNNVIKYILTIYFSCYVPSGIDLFLNSENGNLFQVNFSYFVGALMCHLYKNFF